MSNATELLRRALDKWDAETAGWADLFEEIRAFLAAEPEAEPVAWINIDRGNITMDPYRAECWKGEGKNIEPLYLHPPRPAEPEAEYDLSEVIPLTHRKAKGIIKDRGYHVTGFVLSRPDGDKCIVDMSAVRWLSGKEFFEMMHPVVTSPTAEPEAEPVGEIDVFSYEDETLYLRETIDLNSRFDELLGQKLYIHPPRPEPSRKPITDDEISKAFSYDGQGSYNDFGLGAVEGVRFAEMHHGIGVKE